MGIKKRKSKKGFTVIEAIISLVLFTLIMIPLGSFTLTAVKTSVKSGEKQQAIDIAQSTIEQIKALKIDKLYNLSTYPDKNKIVLNNGMIITLNKENIEYIYISSIKEFNNNINDEFKEKFRSCLIKNRKRDKEKGITTVGPHRDDFMVLINNIDTKSYGSQGQQRTAVLTMKFSSLKIIKEITGEYPVLLLDDVLSELDFNRKKYILSTINNIQTIITCTGISDICEYLDNESKIFKVQEGHISS